VTTDIDVKLSWPPVCTAARTKHLMVDCLLVL